jgi:hypothetical protein
MLPEHKRLERTRDQIPFLHPLVFIFRERTNTVGCSVENQAHQNLMIGGHNYLKIVQHNNLMKAQR